MTSESSKWTRYERSELNGIAEEMAALLERLANPTNGQKERGEAGVERIRGEAFALLARIRGGE